MDKQADIRSTTAANIGRVWQKWRFSSPQHICGGLTVLCSEIPNFFNPQTVGCKAEKTVLNINNRADNRQNANASQN